MNNNIAQNLMLMSTPQDCWPALSTKETDNIEPSGTDEPHHQHHNLQQQRAVVAMMVKCENNITVCITS